MKLFRYIPLIIIVLLLSLPSCIEDQEEPTNYYEWRDKNIEYINNLETQTEGGVPVFQKIIPDWDNSVYVLVRWHNDREETTNLLTPLSNSTIRVKYTLTNIEGDTLDTSSSFVCQPNGLVTGFWTAVTNMHEKDTVTAVMPYIAGYGYSGSGRILPYSTLIFGIRLDSIVNLVTN